MVKSDKKSRSPKLLIIGVDGADPDLIEAFVQKGVMPVFAGLIKQGAYGPLAGEIPPTTLPAWTSFMTGTAPSTHGLPDFTVKDGYAVRFTGGKDRRVPTWLEHLEQHGLKVGSAWFPATYPPLPLNGYQISGWDSPVTSFGDASFVKPKSLHKELVAAFPKLHLSFDAINEFDDSPNWYENAAANLPARVSNRADMAIWLLKKHPVDVAAFYFGETDTVSHHFWAHHDANSPRRPFDKTSFALKDAIENVYRAVDDAVGRLIHEVGNETSVIILSDHGSCGSSNVALHLNRFLESNGFLTFKKSRAKSLFFQSDFFRGKMVAHIPHRMRRTLFRLAGGFAPAFVESKLRFQGINWSETVAFSEEITYAPSIWFNQLGREPKGTLNLKDRARLTRDLSDTLKSWTTADGTNLISKVIPREDLHTGKHIGLFPDLILKLNQIDNYTPVCLPSGGKSGLVLEKLDKKLGRKGRSLPGCHADNGILLISSKTILHTKITGGSLKDIAGIICKITKVPAASWFESTPITGLPFADKISSSQASPPDSPAVSRSYTHVEERVVADRLKRLGYLE